MLSIYLNIKKLIIKYQILHLRPESTFEAFVSKNASVDKSGFLAEYHLIWFFVKKLQFHSLNELLIAISERF